MSKSLLLLKKKTAATATAPINIHQGKQVSVSLNQMINNNHMIYVYKSVRPSVRPSVHSSCLSVSLHLIEFIYDKLKEEKQNKK